MEILFVVSGETIKTPPLEDGCLKRNNEKTTY